MRHAVVHPLFVFGHEGVHAADAAAHIHAQPVAVDFAFDAAVVHGLHRGGHGILGIQVGFADFGFFHVLGGVKILDFPGHADFAVRVGGDVEFMDGVDPAFAFNQATARSVGTSLPTGEIVPRPVITTRLLMIISSVSI